MSPIQFVHLQTEDGGQALTIFLPGEAPVVVNGDHPQFDELLDAASEGATAEEIRELADLSVVVAERFDRLSERVSVANGRVYFDGDEIDSSITRQIVRCLAEDVGDWRPLVRFLESLAANPQEHSREQLYDWLAGRDFTILADGSFVAYKGVKRQEDGSLVSINRGPAIVDGEAVNGAVPNAVGSTVEIARSAVAFDPSVGCASGLHVGSYDYAKSWAQGAVLLVRVYPRDVVSVPTDSNAAKVRVCRYSVVEVIDAPETAAVVYDEEPEDCGCGLGPQCPDYPESEGNECPDCGEFALVDDGDCQECP